MSEDDPSTTDAHGWITPWRMAVAGFFVGSGSTGVLGAWLLKDGLLGGDAQPFTVTLAVKGFLAGVVLPPCWLVGLAIGAVLGGITYVLQRLTTSPVT